MHTVSYWYIYIGLHISCDIRVIIINVECHWSNVPASAFDLLVARMSEMSIIAFGERERNGTKSNGMKVCVLGQYLSVYTV